MKNKLNASEIFSPIYGRPAWRVVKGVGSFITMEFGEPTLSIREPTNEIKNRRITVHGQWHLWIYCCSWSILERNICLATDESPDDAINNGLNFIDGQILEEVIYDKRSKITKFIFELNGVLETVPYPTDPQDQWLVFYDKKVWTMGFDGTISVASDDEVSFD